MVQMLEVAEKALELIKVVICVDDYLKCYNEKRESTPKSLGIDFRLDSLNLFALKQVQKCPSSDCIEDDVSIAPMFLFKVNSTKLKIILGDQNQMKISFSMKSFALLDFCQLNYQIYNQTLKIYNSSKSIQSVRPSFQTVSQIQSLKMENLIQRYEDQLIAFKHSQFISEDENYPVLEVKVSLQQYQEYKYKFSERTIDLIQKEIDKYDQLTDKQHISLIFNHLGQLKIVPQSINLTLSIRDLMIRGQPLLSQKMDQELDAMHNFFKFALNKPDDCKAFLYKQTSLMKEMDFLVKSLKKEDEESLKSIEMLPFDHVQNQDNIKIDIQVKNFALDMHPVVQFKTYIDLFGDQLQKNKRELNINYPTYNNNHHVRVSQRLIIYLQELNSKLHLDQRLEKQSLSVVANNFTIHLLDQSNTHDLLNPIALLPGMGLRVPLRLNDGTLLDNCSYLESLGFCQILLVDYIQVMFEKETLKCIQNAEVFKTAVNLQKEEYKKFETFKVSVNVKRIVVHLTKDSYKTMVDLQKSIESNQEASKKQQTIVQEEPVVDMLFQGQTQLEQPYEDMTHSFIDEFEHIEESKSQSSQKYFIVGKKNEGPNSINLKEMMSNDYIPKIKKSENSKKLRYKKSHAMPMIPTQKYMKNLDTTELGVASNDDKIQQNPKKLMQPKFAISLHVQLFDIRFFQGLEFDFAAFDLDFQRPASRHSIISVNSSFSQKQRIREDYMDEPIEKAKIQFKRKKLSKKGNYHQILVKNLLVSSYKMKDINMVKRQEKMFYKYEKQAISIQNVQINENITSQGQMLVETFHLPESFKYDNFCELVTYTENYVILKEKGFRGELQPFKIKFRQDILNFLIEFFGVEVNASQKATEDQQLLKPLIDQTNLLTSSMIEKNGINQSQIKTTKKQVPIIIKELKIKETSLSLSYSSKWLSINELLNHGNKLECLNIFNINDLVLHIKPFDQKEKQDYDLAIKNFIKFYQDDIISNQKLNMVGAIGPLRGLFNIFGALSVVVSRPYEGFRHGDLISAAKGFREGMGTLYGTLREEGDNVYKKVYKMSSIMYYK